MSEAERAIRDLTLLERVRAHPAFGELVENAHGMVSWWDATDHGCDEAMQKCADDCKDAYALLAQLLSPGDAGRGEGRWVMDTFKVWDEINSEEECAFDVQAFDAEDAAKTYAEEDTDGHCDGIYYAERGDAIGHDLKRRGQPICVRCPDGSLRRFAVGVVEFEPVYGAEELPVKECSDD